MSHGLSQATVAGKIGYLIEEYHAYQVGFVAQFGEAYGRLFGSLSLDVKTVVEVLQEIRTAEFVAQKKPFDESVVAKMRAIIQSRLISEESRHEPAPAFGWSGFEMNEPKNARRKE